MKPNQEKFTPIATLLWNVALVMLLTAGAPGSALAQGDFPNSGFNPFQPVRPAVNNDSQHQWQPPAAHRQPPPERRLIQPPVLAQNTQPERQQPPDRFANASVSTGTWPQQAVSFDQPVQQATLETSTSDATPSAIDRLGESMGSASEMLGNLKVSLSEKANGWLTSDEQGGWTERVKSLVGSASVRKTIGSLALVAGLYFAFVVVMRKFGHAGARSLPPEVVEVLGQLPYGPRQNLQLIRLGSNLLLLMNGPEGAHPIGEITEPQEVQLLSDACRRTGGLRSTSNTNVASAVRRLANMPRQQGHGREITNENLGDVLRRLERAANVSSQSSFEV